MVSNIINGFIGAIIGKSSLFIIPPSISRLSLLLILLYSEEMFTSLSQAEGYIWDMRSYQMYLSLWKTDVCNETEAIRRVHMASAYVNIQLIPCRPFIDIISLIQYIAVSIWTWLEFCECVDTSLEIDSSVWNAAIAETSTVHIEIRGFVLRRTCYCYINRQWSTSSQPFGNVERTTTSFIFPNI